MSMWRRVTAAAVPQPNALAAIRAASFSAFGVGASILSSASKATESSNALTPIRAPPPRAMAETEPHAKRNRGGTSRPCFGVASASLSHSGNGSAGGSGGAGAADDEELDDAMDGDVTRVVEGATRRLHRVLDAPSTFDSQTWLPRRRCLCASPPPPIRTRMLTACG